MKARLAGSLAVAASAFDPPPPGEIVPELPRFSGPALRGAGSLEFTHTAEQVRAYDPYGQFVAIIGARETGSPRLMVEARAGTPGVVAQAVVARETRLLALSAASAIDEDSRDLLCIWAAEVLRHPEWMACVRRVENDRVHVRCLSVEPEPDDVELRVQQKELSPAPPEVKTLLSKGRAHGMQQRLVEAAAAYDRALTVARSVGSPRGVVTAAVGLHHALYALGYPSDAAALIRGVIATEQLDRKCVASLCQSSARDALLEGAWERAGRWLDRADAAAPSGRSPTARSLP